jgi:hypothetical protein
MDELWTEGYNKGVKSNIPRIEEPISSEFKKFVDTPQGPSFWQSDDHKSRLEKSLKNADLFYNPVDKVGEDALKRFEKLKKSMYEK